MKKMLKNGTGLSHRVFDYEKKYVSIDFSGIDKYQYLDDSQQCFRNDSSIFFYVANSYLTSFYVLSQQLEKSFETKNCKEVEHLILPYYFNFRHYIEIELKALIVGLANEVPKTTHKLTCLWKDFSEILNSLEYYSCLVLDNITQEFFENKKLKILCILKRAEILLQTYAGNEPSVEYYRFIFDKNMELNDSIIELDFACIDKKLRELADQFKEINVNLREIVYLYFSI